MTDMVALEPAVGPRKARKPSGSHWQELAEGYDPVMGQDPAMRALWECILDRLPPSPRRILDLGTGTGILLQLVQRRFPDCRLVGIDPAPAMLEKTRRKLPSAELILGSAEEIEQPEGTFDAVVSNFALHHLSHPQKQRCAEEIHRVLAPGGTLVFGDQYCPRMGTPEDPEWVEEMLDHFSSKARYFLRTAGVGRMLLQVRLMPRLLTADGEIPCTVDFWLDSLRSAGFSSPQAHVVEPAFLLHRVLTAHKEGRR